MKSSPSNFGNLGFWTWLARLSALGLLVACGPDSPSQTSPRDPAPAEVALPTPLAAEAATPQYAGPIENPPDALISTVAPQPESAPAAASQGPTAVLVQPKPSVQRKRPVESEAPAGLPLPRGAKTVEPARPLPPARTSTTSRDPTPLPAITTPAESTTNLQAVADTVVSDPAPESTSPAPVETPPTPSSAPAATPAPEPNTSPPAVPSAVPSSLSDNAQTESAPIDESLEQAPSFTLPTVGGGAASLDSYLGERNVVLVFYRAFW